MNYPFYYFAILSVLVNLYLQLVNAHPPKSEAGISDGQSVNSLADQMEKVLKKREYTDVQFLVGEGDKKKVVSAHRAILSSASDVFEAMFRYDKGQIEVPDIEIEAFEAMLTFIYAKRFNGLDDNNWLDVLKAANKYNITGLVKKCVDFPIKKLPNVFVAFEQALLRNLEDFALRCLRYIDQNELMKSEAFLQIDQSLLCVILEKDELRSSEIEIWNTALRWADEQCRQNEIECSAENQRKMLGQALFNIRFPLIPKVDFTKSVVSTNVLTTEEVDSIYQHYSHTNLSDAPGLFPLKFPTHRRYKYEDTIEMEIEKVSEFALEEVGNERFSDAKNIGGFSWKIWAKIKTKDESNENWLAVFLEHDGPENENWSCKNSTTLRIISQKNGTEDLIGTFIDRIFKKEKSDFGFPNFISFTELLDASKGLYNKDEDKVKLAIDVIVDAPKAEKFVSDPNKSNDTLSMEIEKLSEFAREVFGERKSEAFYIKGMPWKIVAYIATNDESIEKWLTIYLLFDVSEEDGNLSSECSSATFRIVSQKNGVEDLEIEYNETTRVFNSEAPLLGVEFIAFAELMEPSKGLYNKDEDKVKVAIDLTCE